LTGEFDRQLQIPTLSRTVSRFGVVGTDLGQSFEHDGRLVFLFGDTDTDGNIRQDPLSALDSIAFTSTVNPQGGILLDFNPTYPHVEGEIDQQAFCVPADGISIDRSRSGPGWIIQGDLGSGGHGNFEVVALQGPSSLIGGMTTLTSRDPGSVARDCHPRRHRAGLYHRSGPVTTRTSKSSPWRGPVSSIAAMTTAT
jgi:hypothetical protein